MAHDITEKNRRAINLVQSRIKEALPAYYSEDNPNLITFLEKYYDFLDSDGQYAFSSSVREIISARDTQQNSSELLNEVIKEIGDGLQSASFFHQPRLMAKLLGAFYRSKGTLVSAEGFFRGFFNESLEVEYPKDQIIFVGESNIGFEDRKFIQNNELYQIFSILLKTGISTRDYEVLYKKFVHPAGWYFQGEVVSTNEINLNVNHLASGDSIRPDPLDLSTKVFGPETFITPVSPFHDFTILLDSNGQDVRASLTNTIAAYQDLTAAEINNFYTNFIELIDPNSFTFDDGRRQRAFDVASDIISFSNTSGYDGNNPTLRLVGTINEWNNHQGTADSNFGAYPNAPGNPPTMGTMTTSDASGFIDSNTTIMVTGNLNDSTTGSPGEPYVRTYTTNQTVDLSNVDTLFYWVNKGSGGWGNDPQGHPPSGEMLRLQIGKTLSADGTIANATLIDSTGQADLTSNVWTKKTVSITGIADSDVYIQFKQAGNQFGDVKDNWAFTSVFVGIGNRETYDSSGPDLSMATETMDNDMFTRYSSDSSY